MRFVVEPVTGIDLSAAVAGMSTFDAARRYLPSLLRAAVITIVLSCLSMALAVCLGVVIASGRVYANRLRHRLGRSGGAFIAPAHAAAEKAEVVALCASIESEIADLDDEEKEMFLADLGLKETGLTGIVRTGFKLLDLLTFFTIGPKEARAWTVRRGATAPEAAGVIHTDFEKGFIRAETIAAADYIALNGEQGAKEAGKLRLEGKEYLVQDGDVFHFRFNV